MKRIWRNDMQPQQREKIGAANRGRHHTPETKRKISASLTKYWAGLPYKPTDEQDRAADIYGRG